MYQLLLLLRQLQNNRDHYRIIISYRYCDNFDLSYHLSIENSIWHIVNSTNYLYIKRGTIFLPLTVRVYHHSILHRKLQTRSSAVTQRPCDASCHWIFHSLKVTGNDTLESLLVFHCNYLSILHSFWDIQHKIMVWREIWVWGCSRSLNIFWPAHTLENLTIWIMTVP